MEAYVAKCIDHRELHVTIYPSRQKLWGFLKAVAWDAAVAHSF